MKSSMINFVAFAACSAGLLLLHLSETADAASAPLDVSKYTFLYMDDFSTTSPHEVFVQTSGTFSGVTTPSNQGFFGHGLQFTGTNRVTDADPLDPKSFITSVVLDVSDWSVIGIHFKLKFKANTALNSNPEPVFYLGYSLPDATPADVLKEIAGWKSGDYEDSEWFSSSDDLIVITGLTDVNNIQLQLDFLGFQNDFAYVDDFSIYGMAGKEPCDGISCDLKQTCKVNTSSGLGECVCDNNDLLKGQGTTCYPKIQTPCSAVCKQGSCVLNQDGEATCPCDESSCGTVYQTECKIKDYEAICVCNTNAFDFCKETYGAQGCMAGTNNIYCLHTA